jgi:hypothetical protein
MMAEGIGIAIPILQLISLLTKPAGGAGWFAAPFMLATTFLMGFNRSGFMAFQSHLLEVSEQHDSIYYIVTKSMVLLPLSFVSMLTGMYFDHFPDAVHPVYIAQIAAGVLAFISAARLKLFLYPKKTENVSQEV